MCPPCIDAVAVSPSQAREPCSVMEREQLIRDWFICDVIVDADERDMLYDSSVKLSASDMEFQIPVAGVFRHGLGSIIDWFLQLRRSIPDLSCALHDVTLDADTAEATFVMSGTQLEMIMPLFPIGKFVEWKFVSSLAFNDSGLVSKECISASLDPCLALSPNVFCGLAQSARFLALNKPGSRLLEDAMESTCGVGLMEQLRGCVMEVAQSHHGNHPLQKYIVSMPPSAVQFIVDEFRGQATAAAMHCTACRVLQRILEQCPCHQVDPLVVELLENVQLLMSNRYGNFVVQRLLDHGNAAAKRRVVDAICCSGAKQLARHWVASNVLRCAIVHCSPEDQARLASAVAPDALELAKLSQHRHGSFVAREIKLAARK